MRQAVRVARGSVAGQRADAICRFGGERVTGWLMNAPPENSRISRAWFKRLEAAGFLRREIDAADLRRHRLVVTPTGRKAISRGLALLSDTFAGRLKRLSMVDRTALQRLLEKLA